MRQSMSVVLVWLMFTVSLPARSRPETPAKPTLKEQIFQTPVETTVEVRLRTNEKLRGRLGDISNEMFILKVAREGRFEERKIAFEDLKKLKVFDSRADRVLVYVFLGVTITLTTLLALFLAANHEY